MIKTRKKLNSEIKWGFSILSLYVLWIISWAFYRYHIKGSMLNPYNPVADIKKELIPPSLDSFLLGTDIYGRSTIEIISSGLVYSLSVALIVSISAACIGTLIGYLSVTGPKFVKYICDLFTNLIFIFPNILIAIMVMAITGQSLKGLIFVLIITGWPSYSKIARGETRRIMALAFVESAKAIGVSKIRLFFLIVVPEILPILLVHLILGISGVIISESILGFLGLGGSSYSWGVMLSMAKSVLLEAPYLVVFLSLVMAGIIIGLNLLGDGLRDYLDPKNIKVTKN